MDTIFQGLQEQSRLKIMNEQRRFIVVDNQEAVKIGDLEQNTEPIKVARPKLNKKIFPKAAVREVDELTPWEGQARCSPATPQMWRQRMGPPLVDADWHAACQAIDKVDEGTECEHLYYNFVETNKEVNARNPQWEQQGTDALEHQRRQREMRRPDQRAEDRKS